MDIEAKPIGNDIWHLTDLLGRPVGSIVQTSLGFLVEHDDAGMPGRHRTRAAPAIDAGGDKPA